MFRLWIRSILRGLTLCLAGFLGYVLVQHMQSNDPLPVVTEPVFETTDAGIEGFVYRQTEDGRVQWEVEAQKAESHESEQRVLLKRVQVRLFGKAGQNMELEADEGTINTASGDFELRNEDEFMTIELLNGYTILTPHVHWVDAEQTIRTDRPVTIHGPGLTITGSGLVAELTTETVGVLDDVHVRITS